jgi:hypothetical protein
MSTDREYTRGVPLLLLGVQRLPLQNTTDSITPLLRVVRTDEALVAAAGHFAGWLANPAAAPEETKKANGDARHND